MEGGMLLSSRSAAIQRRNIELEQILAAAAGEGRALSVIREGTHEGPTTSMLAPSVSLPGEAKGQLDDSGSDAQLGATVRGTLPYGMVVDEFGDPAFLAQSQDMQRLRNEEPQWIKVGKRVLKFLGFPRAAVGKEEHQGWRLVPGSDTPGSQSDICGELESRMVEFMDDGSKQPPPSATSVSHHTFAVQLRNAEPEEQVRALQAKPPQAGVLSAHSLALQRRNDELERRLTQLQRKSSTVSLSPAAQALNRRNQELEQQLLHAEADMKRASDEERAKRISLRAREVEEMITKAQELDLVFLVDCTGSMQDYIDMVKYKVVDIANGIRRMHTQLALRVAFAAYRDYDDRAIDDHDTCDFTSSFEGAGSTFVQALTRVRAVGGSDDAEDVFSGLQRVARLSWRATTRVLVHIADAPCHGWQFHDGLVQDHYPSGDPWSRDVGSLLKSLHQDCKLASYLFCHINDTTRKMVHEFKRYVARPGSRPWIEEVHLSSAVDNLVQIVVTNASSTILHAMSADVPQQRHVRQCASTTPWPVPSEFC